MHLCRYWLRFLIICCSLLLLDAITKHAVFTYLPLRQGFLAPHIPLFQGFLAGIDGEITHIRNTGAAWGVFSAFPHALLYFRMAFITVLIFYALFYAEAALVAPLALIASGAIGNVLDYFIYGHVIDMFHLQFWGWDYPVFNVADSAICIGTFWIFWILFIQKRNKQKE